MHPDLPSRIKMVGCTKDAMVTSKRGPGCDPDKYVWGSLLFLPRPPVRAKIVVDADGIHSQVRACIFPGHSTRFCGNLNWNGIVRNDSDACTELEIQYMDTRGNRTPIIKRRRTIVPIDSTSGMLRFLSDAGGEARGADFALSAGSGVLARAPRAPLTTLPAGGFVVNLFKGAE
jgi:hypothetical protein